MLFSIRQEEKLDISNTPRKKSPDLLKVRGRKGEGKELLYEDSALWCSSFLCFLYLLGTVV